MSSQKHKNALFPGDKIGNYRLDRVLGQGGFGITYLAYDEKLDRELAVKEYFPAEFSRRETDGSVTPQSCEDETTYLWGLERFLNEGKTLARFKHPNIVRVIDYIEANNTAYIIMEYEHGHDLLSLLKQRKNLTIEEFFRIFLPLLEGLSQVHKTGFIHRDVKPANIFIRNDGSPVLIDFGSAREGMINKTRTLTTLVSPGYAPFEQYNADGKSKQGPWTDIYALGASMYKSLFGRSPLDALSRAEERIAGRPDPIMTAAGLGMGHYPAHVLEAIDRSLAFLPENRPRTIEEWLSQLMPPASGTNSETEETVKIAEYYQNKTQGMSEAQKISLELDEAGLRLPVTRYILFGLFSFWSYTAFSLSGHITDIASGNSSIKIDTRVKFLFSGIYILVLLMVFSWVLPNVFLEHVLGENYILPAVFFSALLFYLNTVAFVLWYMKKLKKLALWSQEQQLKPVAASPQKIRNTMNAMIAEWEKTDNHIVFFLVISLPIIFSPYIGARLFYSGNMHEYVILGLPLVIMLLGGIFHVWGTRLLVNAYNNTLAK